MPRIPLPFLFALTLALVARPVVSAGADATPALSGASLLQFVNAHRAQHGLAPLEPAADLAGLAREHCRAMAARGTLGHEGFEERFERSKSSVCVENVGWNHPDARSQFLGWRASPPHDAALLDPRIRRAGIATVGAFVTFFACE